MSGIDTRSGFRKRSNSRSNLSGSDVGDARARRPPASRRPSRGPGPPGCPRSRAALMKSCDDQEVAGVAGLGDDAELVVEPLAHVGGERIAVALASRPPRRGARAGRSRSSTPGGQRERRQVVLLLERRPRPRRRSRACSRARPAGPGKCAANLGRALEVEAAVVAHPVVVAAILAEADAEQHVVRVVVRRRGGSARRSSRRRAGRSRRRASKTSALSLRLDPLASCACTSR